MTNPPCPECGQHAVQTAVREVGEHIHEVTATCPAEHLWTTKWFAVRESA